MIRLVIGLLHSFAMAAVNPIPSENQIATDANIREIDTHLTKIDLTEGGRISGQLTQSSGSYIYGSTTFYATVRLSSPTVAYSSFTFSGGVFGLFNATATANGGITSIAQASNFLGPCVTGSSLTINVVGNLGTSTARVLIRYSGSISAASNTQWAVAFLEDGALPSYLGTADGVTAGFITASTHDDASFAHVHTTTVASHTYCLTARGNAVTVNIPGNDGAFVVSPSFSVMEVP